MMNSVSKFSGRSAYKLIWLNATPSNKHDSVRALWAEPADRPRRLESCSSDLARYFRRRQPSPFITNPSLIGTNAATTWTHSHANAAPPMYTFYPVPYSGSRRYGEILNVQHILASVVAAVESAGHLLAQEYARPSGPRGSGDKAEIDVEIEIFLRAELLKVFPCDWWGEETGHVLTGNAWCWVVDPNDGTSDFLKGLKGSAVSVGLLHNHQPVLGVVHAPVTPQGMSDCLAWAKGMDHLLRNGDRIVVDLSEQELLETSTVMVSAAAQSKPLINGELCSPADFFPMPSIAYRLARVAAGDGVCGVSLYPVSAHDVVAGHALLIGAKGVLVGEDGASVEYKTASAMASISGRVFGGAPSACAELASRDWHKVFE